MCKKILKLACFCLFIIASLFCFTACKEGNKVVLTNVSASLVNTNYEMKGKIITVQYGRTVMLSSQDFSVKATYSNNATEQVTGFSFSSTMPANGATEIGSYTLTFTYKGVKDEVIVNIVKATVDMSNVVWNNYGAFKYDGTEKQVEVINLPEGVSVTYDGVVKAKEAGVYTVVANFTYIDSEKYNPIPSWPLVWSIEKTILNVQNLVLENYVYDELEKNVYIESVDLPENVVVDKIEGVLSATNVGEYSVVVSFKHTGEDKDNYLIPSKSATWKIKKGIYSDVGVVELAQNYDFTYDGTEKEVNVNPLSLKHVRVLYLEGSKQTNAGKYDVTVHLQYIGDNENYQSDAKTVLLENAWEIKAASLLIDVKDNEMTYGDEFINKGYVVSGLKNGETEAQVLKGSPVYDFGGYIENESGAGTYQISVSGFSADNYKITYDKGVLTVNKATVSVDDLEKIELVNNKLVYNGEEQSIVSSEDLTGFINIPVGVKLVLIENNKATNVDFNGYNLVLTLSQDDSGNYNDFSFSKEFEWRIEPKTINITINNSTIKYGEEATANGYSVDESCFVGSDTIALIVGEANYNYGGYVVGSDVGEYEINITGLNVLGGNYKLEIEKGKLIVEKAQIDVSLLVWEDVTNLVYDGEEKKPQLESIPSQIDVSYSYLLGEDEVNPTEVGLYVAKATVELKEEYKNNFEIVGSVSNLSFEIKNA